MGVTVPSLESRSLRRCLASSRAAAVSCASLGECICLGGTTMCGPMLKVLKSAVAEERRRTGDRGCDETRSFPSVFSGASRGKEGSQSRALEGSWG